MEEVTIHHLRAFMLHTQIHQPPADAENPTKHADPNGSRPSTAALQTYAKAIKVFFLN